MTRWAWVLIALISIQAHASPELECLARAVYFEAGIEPLYGKYMVSKVIMNRVASKRYSDTVCDVINEPKQFSSLHHIKYTRPAPGKEWRESRLVAERTLAGTAPQLLSKNVLYFTGKKRPQWTNDMRIIAVTSKHYFYLED